MRGTQKIICGLVLGALIASCHTTGKPIKRLSADGLMYAMIYDYENSPVSGTTVYIGGKKVADSDIQGRFILDKVKKGEYSIKLVKKGYETLEETFEYNPMNVLYFKMVNAGQLLVLAETALDSRDYRYAETCLDRALAIDPARPDILFLKSINCYLQGRHGEAAGILETLLKSGSADPSVPLLLEKVRQAQAEE